MLYKSTVIIIITLYKSTVVIIIIMLYKSTVITIITSSSCPTNLQSSSTSSTSLVIIITFQLFERYYSDDINNKKLKWFSCTVHVVAFYVPYFLVNIVDFSHTLFFCILLLFIHIILTVDICCVRDWWFLWRTEFCVHKFNSAI